MSRISRNSGRSVMLHSNASALPAPSGAPSDGSTAAWQHAGASPEIVEIAVDLHEGGTSATLPKPVYVVGNVDGKWRNVGVLNGGEDVAITEIGYAEVMAFLGTYEYLALYAGGAIVGDEVDVIATPFEVVP